LKRAHTRVQRLAKTDAPLSEFRTAVSLHSHTNCSQEKLDFLPRYIEFHRIPVVTPLIKSELKKYEEKNGKALDFGRAYWTPPVNPRMVFESETEQIRNLGLTAFVSITDHDTIAAPLWLRAKMPDIWSPLSVEWSVPFGGNVFHMGVHNLPPNRASEIMDELAHCTANPSPERIGDLFAMLQGFADLLIVFNHPCCNFVRVGAKKHWASLRQFVAMYGQWIHGLELNGMRPWIENEQVQHLAGVYDMPMVAGGDRHGCAPNAMLNLSHDETWGEFVARIRVDRQNDILILPEYEEPIRVRELATAADVLRRYPHHPPGQRRFTDRIFGEVEGYSWHPLSFYWDGGDGQPCWLSPVVSAVVAIGSDSFRPILRCLFSRGGPNYSSEATSTLMES